MARITQHKTTLILASDKEYEPLYLNLLPQSPQSLIYEKEQIDIEINNTNGG